MTCGPGNSAPGIISRSIPQGFVPALDTGTGIISQSGAIIEYLEERYPQSPLLPADADGRAIVRSMTQIIACDIHPLNNLRVQIYLRDKFNADDKQMSDWIVDLDARGLCGGRGTDRTP